MSAEKELNFFIKERNWDKGISWYEKQFHGKNVINGEASPNYTFYPQFAGVPKRMHDVIPDAKLIYILRDPIKRMIAAYIHAHADGYAPRTLDQTLLDFDANNFIRRSKYYMQLQQYLEYYPLSQILIVTQEDLLQHRQQTLQKIFRFLEVDESFDCKEFGEIKHQTFEKRRKNKVGMYLKRLSKTEVVKMVPSDVRYQIGKVLYLPFSKKINTPKLEAIVEQKIADHLKEDIDQLRELTGIKFEQWDV